MREPKEVTILIVDDDAAFRNALVFDFKRRGFQVLHAENGKVAFELIKTQKVDIVLTDVKMPGGDGVDLLDRVKERSPILPVVMFITGFADISLEEAYDKGADAVFTKPFDRKSLMSAVIRAVSDKEEVWGARASERIDVDFKIELHFPALNHAIQGRVLNIGRGGIFVALSEHYPKVDVKTTFHIRFEHGTPQEISGSGIVRWIRAQHSSDRPAGCGIEFESFNDHCREQLIELINQSKTKAFIPSK